ncbi:MAG: Hsp20 family protein, partial [candidate division Zixibacteria bacterium]|nr:Hsp20 family protein [candidate division Zixibacteria bacterium]
SIVVRAEVPGMDPKDVNITLNDGLLTIKGEKKVEKQEKDENHHLTERRYGSFSRSIKLPLDIQADKIEANYKNGLLTITMPKSEKAKPKEIRVKVE